MRADGVEVSQKHHSPVLIRLCGVAHDLLGHVFGPSVGVGAHAGPAVLAKGHHVIA